jgi:RHS repeat-associated protein
MVASTPVTFTVSAASSGASTALYFIDTDHLGTPRLIENQSQQTVWKWDNAEAFGDSVPNESPNGLGSFTFDLRFPGQIRDVETGTNYNNYRDYRPDGGGYLQPDPIGLKGGINPYLYTDASPIKKKDVRGLESSECAVDGKCEEDDQIPPECMANPGIPCEPPAGPAWSQGWQALAVSLPPDVSKACWIACMAVKPTAGQFFSNKVGGIAAGAANSSSTTARIAGLFVQGATKALKTPPAIAVTIYEAGAFCTSFCTITPEAEMCTVPYVGHRLFRRPRPNSPP